MKTGEQRGLLVEPHRPSFAPQTKQLPQHQQSTIITIPEMAQAMRLSTDSEELDSNLVAILSRSMSAGLAIISAYAPTAPPQVTAEALIRLVSYLFDSPPAGNRIPANAFILSGSRTLLSTWRIPEGIRV